MDSIIITGGAGFIGANFARYALSHTSNRIVILDKLTYAGNRCSIERLEADSRVEFVQADIGDRSAMSSVFARHRPVAVVNFAAETHVDRSIDDPSPFIYTNIAGTYELLEAARAFLKTADESLRRRFRLLHVSTDEVYGSLGPDGLFAESTPYAPNSPYAASKASADHLVRAYHETYQLPVLITNCSNNYGPYQFPEKLIPLTLLNALDAKPLPIYGDGGNVRDWLYVEDHCAGIMLALERGEIGEKYNIGGSNERTNLQVVDAICSALEKLAPASSNPAMKNRGLTAYAELKAFVPDRPGHDRRYAIDAGRIRERLGWKPASDFDSGILSTVRWYLDNRDWCEQVSAKYNRERLGLRAQY